MSTGRELDAKDLRHARAHAAPPGEAAPSQREFASLLGVNQPQVARLERGRRRPRGLVLALYLAIIRAQQRNADLREAFDRSTPSGRRLAVIFSAAYPTPGPHDEPG